jgi:hypothetical protein
MALSASNDAPVSFVSDKLLFALSAWSLPKNCHQRGFVCDAAIHLVEEVTQQWARPRHSRL